MAKKEAAPSMVELFSEFKECKNIDKSTMISVFEESFRSVLAKMYESDDNIDVILNPDKGDVQIFQNLEIVADGEVSNPNREISLTDALTDDPDAEIGEEFTKEIPFSNFGRRAILTLRQTLQSKVNELQRNALYEKFKSLKGELVSGEVYQTWPKETLLFDDDQNELHLSKSDSIPTDYFRKGETVRAVIDRVDNKNNNPKIHVSRTNEDFLRRLFELEVPEIHEGLISIKAIARIPGERAKVAVESYDDRIDPVGACVGVKGSRIQGIVHELRNENIDVINYTTNPELFIRRALAPAKVLQIRLVETEDEKKAEVTLSPEDVSLAIGRNGSNIKLAKRLTGYYIEVYRNADTPFEDDIYLDDFRDEIDGWVIDMLKDKGYLTAKAVLNTPRQTLIDEVDLEEETADFVISVLKKEYED